MLIIAAERYSAYRKYVPAFLDTFEFKATGSKDPDFPPFCKRYFCPLRHGNALPNLIFIRIIMRKQA